MKNPMFFTYRPVDSLNFQFYAKILAALESAVFLGAGEDKISAFRLDGQKQIAFLARCNNSQKSEPKDDANARARRTLNPKS